MTESVREQLSACLDGELTPAELDLLLKRVERDADLRESLGRYALITEALRGRAPRAASKSFADRVMAGIEDGAAIPVQVKRPRAATLRWLRPVAGLAIAAGVATVAVIAFQVPDAPVPQATVAAVDVAAVAPTMAPSATTDRYVVPTPPNGGQPAFVPATRLTNYVVAHSEFSSPLGRRTVLSGVLSDDDEVEEQNDDADVVPADVADDQIAQPVK